MNIFDAIKFLEKQISDPTVGLPEDIFLFITRITPMVNVDLLIKDEKNRTLLSWRNDLYSGEGWHVPGGILRFKEKLIERVQKVIETEIKTSVIFEKEPIAVNEIILPQKTRGHFISFLFKGFIYGNFIPPNEGLTEKDNGYLKWHKVCPDKLIKVHEIYRKYI